MVTGYEAQMYGDIHRIREELTRIGNALEHRTPPWTTKILDEAQMTDRARAGEIGTFTWYDADTVAEPFSGLANIYINQWWVTDQHGRVCLYRNREPYCDPDPDVAAMLLRVSRPSGAAAITRMPIVFLPHRCPGKQGVAGHG